jgi:hypothetical protein
MKVAAQGEMVAEVDAPSGRRYRRDEKTGLFDMAPSDAQALVNGGGFFPSLSGTTRKGVGYRCAACGFGSYVKTLAHRGHLRRRLRPRALVAAGAQGAQAGARPGARARGRGRR